MANICFNTLVVKGDNIKKLLDDIKDQNKELLEVFPHFTQDCSYGIEDVIEGEEATIEFSSKWSFPISNFENLIKQYPTLKWEGYFQEEGEQHFGIFNSINGTVNITPQTALEFYTKYDSEVAKEIAFIKEAPYNDFLKRYTNNYNITKPYLLEPLIKERINVKDIPLFINVDWEDICIEDELI